MKVVVAYQSASPDKITFDNAERDDALRGILKKAKEKLGASPLIAAESPNLLAHEKGGKFLPHRHSEKEKSMLGALAIALPSMREGDELVARHSGEKQALACGGLQGARAPFWLAVYADSQHELLPAKSGHRAALAYNLLRKDGRGAGDAKPPSQLKASRAFAEIARRWNREAEDRAKLARALEHKYADAGLGWGSLKGSDASLAEALRMLGKECNVENEGARFEGSSRPIAAFIALPSAMSFVSCENQWQGPDFNSCDNDDGNIWYFERYLSSL